MIRILAIVCFVAAPAFGQLQNGLRRHWEKGFSVRLPNANGTFTYPALPQDTQTAFNSGWREYPRPEGPVGYELLTLMCPTGAYSLCILYDDTGYVAGIQINFLYDNYVNVFDWQYTGFTPWTIEDNGSIKNYLSTTIFLISPETLLIRPAYRVISRQPASLLQDRSLYLQSFNRQLLKVSTRASDIENNSVYTRQLCYPEMGFHYFYKMTKRTQCDVDTISQWALLVHDDLLVGIVLVYPGDYKQPPNEREVFQHPTKAEVQLIVPDSPECFSDFAASPGMVLMHVYFVDKPESIQCP